MQNKELKPIKGEFIAKTLTKTVVPFGNAAHIVIPRVYLGESAEIKIRKQWMICKRCHETFTDKKDFSIDPLYCQFCFLGLERLKILKSKGDLICNQCKKLISEEVYKSHWDQAICNECFAKPLDANEKKEEGST